MYPGAQEAVVRSHEPHPDGSAGVSARLYGTPVCRTDEVYHRVCSLSLCEDLRLILLTFQLLPALAVEVLQTYLIRICIRRYIRRLHLRLSLEYLEFGFLLLLRQVQSSFSVLRVKAESDPGSRLTEVEIVSYIAFIVQGECIAERSEALHVHIVGSVGCELCFSLSSRRRQPYPRKLHVLSHGLLRLQHHYAVAFAANYEVSVLLVLS